MPAANACRAKRGAFLLAHFAGRTILARLLHHLRSLGAGLVGDRGVLYRVADLAGLHDKNAEVESHLIRGQRARELAVLDS